jgi:hypothetical protein
MYGKYKPVLPGASFAVMNDKKGKGNKKFTMEL